MVIDLLLRYLLVDHGIAVSGDPFDHHHGHFQLFRVDLLLVRESYVPTCQLLCISSFSLKVEQSCRLKHQATVLNRIMLDNVLSLDISRDPILHLHARFAARQLRKDKAASCIANREKLVQYLLHPKENAVPCLHLLKKYKNHSLFI